MAEYSVDAVLAQAALERRDRGDVVTEAMLRAYAERIKADEGAVPVATAVVRDEHGMPYIERMDHSLPVGTHELYTHPPAQAAQVDAMKVLARLARHADDCLSHNVLPTGAGNWHCDCGYDRYVLDGEPTAAAFAPTAEPVAQVEVATLYVEARQCDNCDHLGLNDASETESACHNCFWHGPEPEEDKCPGCGSEDCMYAACPECGNRYSFLADRHFTAPPASPAGVPDGWVLVPREPTDAMCDAGDLPDTATAYDIYKAMLAAAPSATPKSEPCTRNCDCVGPCKAGNE